MAQKPINAEGFQYVLSTVSSLIHTCGAIAAAEGDEGDYSMHDVHAAFDGKGQKLWDATKEWLDILAATSPQMAKQFRDEFGLKNGQKE
jgi:hypothetical protein